MKASKSHELLTDVPASELWKIYGTLRFVELVRQLLLQVLRKFKVSRGDGGVGTVIQVTVIPPGNPSPVTYKEECVKIDNDNYIKEAPSIEYELDDGRTELEAAASNAPLAAAAETIAKYVKEQQATTN